MDIEKLIEQLSARGLSNGSSLGYHSGLFDEAATALSTLQTENEKLREERDEARVDCAVAEKNHADCIADLARVTAERDAAVADLVFIARTYPVELCDDLVCKFCVHFPNAQTGCPGWEKNECFEWRGVKED